jgi:ribosome maturation factor RimP
VSLVREIAGRHSKLVDAVTFLVAPILEQGGYELVLVEMTTSAGHPALRISIDRLSTPGSVSLQDCVQATHLLENLEALDALIPGAYHLEVSSPGVNRPLVKARDFVRFAGEKAQLTLSEPIDGQKRFVGRLGRLHEDVLQLEISRGKTVSIPLGTILKANLKPDTADLFKRQQAMAPVAELVFDDASGDMSGDTSDGSLAVASDDDHNE